MNRFWRKGKHRGNHVVCFFQAKKQRFLKGVVAGLDLTKHEKMKATIAKYAKETRPKLVGVRHLIDFEDEDFLTRADVHEGLAILESNGLTFDLQVLQKLLLCEKEN